MMNIAKHMEAILIIASVALTTVAAIVSPEGSWHTGDLAAVALDKSATFVVNEPSVAATLAR